MLLCYTVGRASCYVWRESVTTRVSKPPFQLTYSDLSLTLDPQREERSGSLTTTGAGGPEGPDA